MESGVQLDLASKLTEQKQSGQPATHPSWVTQAVVPNKNKNKKKVNEYYWIAGI